MITVSGEITVTSALPDVDADRLGQFSVSWDVDGDTFRRKITLPDGVWVTPNVDGLTVKYIAVFITGAFPVDIGFGQGEPIQLVVGGPPASWPGAQIPSLRAVGGASEVVFFAVTEIAV